MESMKKHQQQISEPKNTTKIKALMNGLNRRMNGKVQKKESVNQIIEQ